MNPLIRNIAIGAGIALAAFLILRRSPDQKAADERLGFTEETGIVGQLGAGANRASGGLLSRFGRFIGDKIDPVNRKSLDELTQTEDIPPKKVSDRTPRKSPKLRVVGILPDARFDG